MKSLVSVIITTRNEDENIRACLESVWGQTYKSVESIVVDNGSTDRTVRISRGLGAAVYDQGPERSAQRNFGAKKANGSYLLFLDADMILTPGVVSECVGAVTGKQYLGVIIPERSIGHGFWSRCKVLEREFYIGVDWIEAARFYKAEIFRKLGGYDETNTGTEDFDMSQRLEAAFGKNSVGRTTSVINHNEGHLGLIATCVKKYYYAKKLHRYRQRQVNRQKFTVQANILVRYKLYFSKPRVLFRDPLVGIGMLFMKTCEFIAGGIGFVIGSVQRKI